MNGAGGWVVAFVLAFGSMFALVGVLKIGSVMLDPGPLMMTPAHVDGDWPFVADEVHVTCCVRGAPGIVGAGGQVFYFANGPHVRRYPVTMLGHEGLTLDDFEAARAAAKELYVSERGL